MAGITIKSHPGKVESAWQIEIAILIFSQQEIVLNSMKKLQRYPVVRKRDEILRNKNLSYSIELSLGSTKKLT